VRAGGVWDEVRYKKYETDYYRKGGGFKTPTGKVEIYSTHWHKLGYDPLPIYFEPPEALTVCQGSPRSLRHHDAGAARYPGFSTVSTRQIERLRKQHPFPRCRSTPLPGISVGLKDGRLVWVESPRGRCRQKVSTLDGIDERVIHAEHGWWFPEREGAEPHLYDAFDSNINCLTSDEPPFLDIGFGAATSGVFSATIYKADAPAR